MNETVQIKAFTPGANGRMFSLFEMGEKSLGEKRQHLQASILQA